MADRTDCRLTRDLMLEAVPCRCRLAICHWAWWSAREAHQERSGRTYSSANILATWETWDLGAVWCESVFRFFAQAGGSPGSDQAEGRRRRTDDEGNHGCAIATGSFKTLDELLDLPDLNLKRGENARVSKKKNCRIFWRKVSCAWSQAARGSLSVTIMRGIAKKKMYGAALARKISHPQRGRKHTRIADAHTGPGRRGAVSTYVSLGLAAWLVHIGGVWRSKCAKLPLWLNKDEGDWADGVHWVW